jgi:capsular polysaccharide biosynthesis protein/Mrp family chromosome partitioning ATPase
MTMTGPVALGEQVSYRSYDYVALLRRRWWILVLGVLLGGVAGLGAAKLVPKSYTSQTSVLVQQGAVTDQTSSRTSSTGVNVDNEAQLVTSTVVVQEAQHLLKTSTPVATLVQDITVTVPPNTAILTIACQASKPTAAQACASAVASAYIGVRAQSLQTQVSNQLTNVNNQIKALTAQVQKISGQVSNLPAGSPDLVFANAQKSVIIQTLNTLYTQQANLTAPIAPPALVISGASMPTSPSKPSKVLFLASGVMVGLLLALLLAVLLQRMDRRVHDARTLRNSRVPVLSDIAMGGRRRPLSLVNASMTGAHSFGLLSNVVLARLERGGHLVLGVVAIKPGAAASVVAASLSDSLAGGGRRVVHIVADPSSATPSLLGAPKGPGLADVLEHPEPDAVEHLPGWGSPFQVITPGRASDKLGRWLGSEAMNRLVARVHEQADLVVVEGSDLTTSADSYAIALTADATVIVVEAVRTTVDEIDQALDQFARLGVPVLGLVLVTGLPGAHAITPTAAPLATKATTVTVTSPDRPAELGAGLPGEPTSATTNPVEPVGTPGPMPGSNEPNPADVASVASGLGNGAGGTNGTTHGMIGAAAFDVLPGTTERAVHGTDRPS